MTRNPVKSSMINSIGYDPDEMDLEIEFISGKTVTYHNVPVEVYYQLMETSSKGKFFHALIRDIYDYD